MDLVSRLAPRSQDTSRPLYAPRFVAAIRLTKVVEAIGAGNNICQRTVVRLGRDHNTAFPRAPTLLTPFARCRSRFSRQLDDDRRYIPGMTIREGMRPLPFEVDVQVSHPREDAQLPDIATVGHLPPSMLGQERLDVCPHAGSISNRF